MTQSQLGAAELTKGFISLVEKGRAQPSIDTLRLLARRLQIPIGYLLEDSGALGENAVRATLRTAWVALKQGKLAEAHAEFAAALSAAQEQHDATAEADSRIGLGSAVAGLRDFEQAVDHLRRGREVAEAARNGQHLARISYVLGQIEAARRNLAAAREHFLHGYQVASEHGCPDRSLIGDLLLALGQAAAESGDHEEAARWYREAVTLLGPTQDLEQEADAHARLGAQARERGAHEVALGHLARAEHAFETVAALRRLAQAQNWLGTVLLEDGKPDEAIAHLQHALLIAERTGDDVGRARGLVGLAQALMSTGAFSQAERSLAEAERLSPATRGGAQSARIELARAQLLRRTGHPTEALTYYQQAITSFEHLGKRSDLARACNELGELLLEQERPSEAAPYLARALEELNPHRPHQRAT